MQGINADAYGVAALAIVTSLVFKLIEKKVLTKEEVIDAYQNIATAKTAKGAIYESTMEATAGSLVDFLAAEIENRS
jgi:hypothetical protein